MGKKKLKLPTPNPYSAKSDTEVNLEWAMNQKGRANRTAAFAMVTKRRGQTQEENPNFNQLKVGMNIRENPGASALYLEESIKKNKWHDYVSPLDRGTPLAPLKGGKAGGRRGA